MHAVYIKIVIRHQCTKACVLSEHHAFGACYAYTLYTAPPVDHEAHEAIAMSVMLHGAIY